MFIRGAVVQKLEFYTRVYESLLFLFPKSFVYRYKDDILFVLIDQLKEIIRDKIQLSFADVLALARILIKAFFALPIDLCKEWIARPVELVARLIKPVFALIVILIVLIVSGIMGGSGVNVLGHTIACDPVDAFAAAIFASIFIGALLAVLTHQVKKALDHYR